jgi:esterase/lipase superfamily enzyme
VDQLITQFKQFYGDLTQLPVDQFNRLYTDDVIFRDPVHELRGGAELLSYLEPLCRGLEFGRFEYLDELVQGDTAYIKWNMNFRNPKLGERIQSVRGMSHIQFNDRIYYHEDVYDLGAMLYEHVPVVGKITRWLKYRLVS